MFVCMHVGNVPRCIYWPIICSKRHLLVLLLNIWTSAENVKSSGLSPGCKSSGRSPANPTNRCGRLQHDSSDGFISSRSASCVTDSEPFPQPVSGTRYLFSITVVSQSYVDSISIFSLYVDTEAHRHTYSTTLIVCPQTCGYCSSQ